jgi:hypothetical protein
VLINLVQNAAESIGRDGSVTLRARAGEARFKDRIGPPLSWKWKTTARDRTRRARALVDPFFSTKKTALAWACPSQQDY